MVGMKLLICLTFKPMIHTATKEPHVGILKYSAPSRPVYNLYSFLTEGNTLRDTHF